MSSYIVQSISIYIEIQASIDRSYDGEYWRVGDRALFLWRYTPGGVEVRETVEAANSQIIALGSL